MDKKALPVFIIFGLIGFGLLAGAGAMLQNSLSFKASASQTDAVVIDLIERRDSEGDLTYSPEVEYTIDGVTRTYVASYSSYPAGYAVGDPATVLYDPNNPDKVKLDGFGSLYLGPSIMGGIGLIFALIGVVPYSLMKRREKQIKHLKMQGHSVSAKVVSVEKNTSYKVNGKSPWRIMAQAHNPLTNTVDSFKSDNLWYDPSEFVSKDQAVTVYVDPQKPSVHFIDLSFLPKHNS